MSRNRVSLCLFASLMGGTALADVPNVAVDIAPVHSLVARVMEGVGTPALIVPPGASPHEYSLRPSEAQALQDAEIVVWMGADLAPWMEDAVATLADGASVMTLLEAEETQLLDFREDALFEAHSHDHGGHDHGHDHGEEEHAEADGHDHDHNHAHDDDHGHDHAEHAEGEGHDHDHDHDHAEKAEADGHDHDHDHADHSEHDHDHDHDHAGHAHGAHDPHAWLSPGNASRWLNLIAAELSAADPDNAGTYFANAAAASEELDALTGEITEILAPVRGGNFIVFHDAYQYFETDFEFPASGAISLSDATDPSPARIAEIQGRVSDEGIDCVLAEPQYNPDLVTTVLDGTEANTGVIDPLGVDLEPGPALYPQLLRNMATTLAECL